MIDKADVQELTRLERTVNGDMGVSCVRDILLYLRQGDFESAKNVRQADGDKTRQYAELEPVLYRMFGCRVCDGWSCKHRKADLLNGGRLSLKKLSSSGTGCTASVGASNLRTGCW